MLAIKHDGADLAPEHGGPCRLVIPSLYPLRADPWREERYSGDETDAMQQMRTEAARCFRGRPSQR